MDRSRDASFFAGSSPPSPTPPLALSDLLAQKPFPPYTYIYDRPVTSPKETTFAEADGNPGESDGLVGSDHEIQPQHQRNIPAAATDQEELIVRAVQPPAFSTPTDWLATRSQLRPSRNQGNKADWIRGWSEAVSQHGDNTYCACSNSLSVKDLSWTIKGGEIKGGVRAILRGKKPTASTPSSNIKPISSASEPDICCICSRLPSPPATPTPSLKGDKMEPQKKYGLGRTINGLFRRAKAVPGRRKDSHERGVDERGHGVSRVQSSEVEVEFDMRLNTPQDPFGARAPFPSTRDDSLSNEASRAEVAPWPNLPSAVCSAPLVDPSPEPITRKPKSMGDIPTHNTLQNSTQKSKPSSIDIPSLASPAMEADLDQVGAGSSPSQVQTASNSDSPRADDTIQKSMSRLQRAAGLLQRMGPRGA
ncbi:hypothetical protein B0T25DRAFT_561312 [Lasiosphaeria hispida]|uniref:Uncharacterized protein n=1 Tax=Lasiosphaeria hispida TaxID=260671 RepID=A0AAJ0HT23_9PEZI|nr:hypothetical protein B0T25DRAFT_561312 [Lasiosphaeria hispida]